MENFYKKIKKQLNTSPKAQTDWSVWDKISGEVEYSSIGIPLWWWLPVVAVFSGLVGYFLHFHDDDVVPIKNMVYLTDTIYIDKELVLTDTLYINRYLSKSAYNNEELNKIPQYASLQKQQNILQKEMEDLKVELNSIGQTIAKSNLSRDSRLMPFVNNYLARNPEHGIKLFEERSLLDDYGYLYPEIYSVDLINRPPIVRNVFWDGLINSQEGESFFNKLIPDYFNVGVAVEGPGIAFHNRVGPGLDLGMAVQIEALFSPKLSILLGVGSRLSTGYSKELETASIFPQPQNVDENSTFDNLNIKSKIIELPLSIKYKINQNQKWDFFVRGGITFSKLSEIEYKYEYKNNNNEIYYEVKEEHCGWNAGTFILGLGIESNVFAKWTLGIEPQLRYNFNSKVPNKYKNHTIGLRLAMMYQM